VLLSTKGIRWAPNSEATSSSLLAPWIGPFPIKTLDRDLGNITLELPPTMRCHNTFYLNEIKPYYDPTVFANRPVHDHPDPILAEDGYDNYEVAEILNHRYTKHATPRLQFLVRWKGYGPEHDTWEPEDCFTYAQEILHDYRHANRL
jgi:hypothetical protein